MFNKTYFIEKSLVLKEITTFIGKSHCFKEKSLFLMENHHFSMGEIHLQLVGFPASHVRKSGGFHPESSRNSMVFGDREF